MIEVKNLSKSFGSIKAVDNISFQIKPGEVLGFLGPNGAGKSTTMRMITGFITPDAGQVKVNGLNLNDAPMESKRCMGYLPENSPLYEDMKVEDFLIFIASVRGISGDAARNVVKQVYDKVGLWDVRHQAIHTLSKGFKRRVGLAQAILNDPPILILDEPTDGLDPNQKSEVRKLIRSMSREKVIVISTHILEEVEELCTRVVIIAGGKVVADKDTDQLKLESRRHGVVSFVCQESLKADMESVFQADERIAHVDGNPRPNQKWQVHLYPKTRSPEFFEIVLGVIKARSWPVEDMAFHSGSLNDVFHRLTLSQEEKRS